MLTRFALTAALLASCAPTTDDGAAERRRRPDAAVADATSEPPPSSTGTVSCYRQTNPGATCASPQVCCFGNYSAQHDGACSSGACTWGAIACDGPEDCASGQHCCSHTRSDPEWGILGYTLSCQISACGAPPLEFELCHAGGTCSNGRTCVTAYGNANELPRSLYVCK